jgi:hypothetical protein
MNCNLAVANVIRPKWSDKNTSVAAPCSVASTDHKAATIFVALLDLNALQLVAEGELVVL